MKIKYALHGCNSNPDYLDYWPSVASAWEALGVTPVLFYIQDDPAIKPADRGIIHTYSPLASDIVMQVLWLRYWGAVKFYADDIIVVSDMDMLPLSRWHLVEQLRQYDDSLYVHLNRRYTGRGPLTVDTVEYEELKTLQTCYNIAKGSTFQEIFELPDEWEKSLSLVAPYFKFNAWHGALWYGDERYITDKVQEYSDRSRIILIDIQKNPPPAVSCEKLRQDVFYEYIYKYSDIGNDSFYYYDIDLIEKGYYIDAHLHIKFSRGEGIATSILNRKAMPPEYVHTLERCFTLMKRHYGWCSVILLGYPFLLCFIYAICNRAAKRYADISYFKCMRRVKIIFLKRILYPIYKSPLLKFLFGRLMKFIVVIKNRYNFKLHLGK